jgi:dolichol kinase
MVVSASAAALVWGLPHPAGAVLVSGAAAVALSVELARQSSPGFQAAFQRRLGPLLRPAEGRRLTGATHLALGFTFAAVLFPGWPAVAGILVAGVADPVAALVGRRAGRYRFAPGRSVAGSMSFLAVATAIVWSVPGAGVGWALGSAALLTGAEAMGGRVNDNLYLPVLTAALVALISGGGVGGGFS